ncbi:MAG: flavodoxin [Bacteroidales bacterium]|nr:flavodoxin [Bacteroidales bacterium]
MRKLLYLAVAVVLAAFAIQSCAKKQTGSDSAEADDSKILVCYFSATGITEKAARRIAALTGGTLHEIAPAVAYTDSDLDWRDSLSRSYVEMHNRDFRPALKDSVTDMSDYNVVFIGYPNWWNTHPTIINTFIESNDLKGKTVVPFMTSGGSNIINSENELHEAYPGIMWAKGLLMNDVSDDDIKDWLSEYGL